VRRREESPQQRAGQVRRERMRHARELVMATAVLAFAWGLANSPLVYVHEVQVTAPDAELQRLVTEAIHLPSEASTLFYPLSRIERQVLRLPEAQAVEIERMPFHTLTVKVYRRVPIALVTGGTAHFLVGEDGVLVGVVPPGKTPLKLPVIDGLVSSEAQPGQRLQDGSRWVVTQAVEAGRRGGLTGEWHLDCSQPFDLCLSYGNVKGFLGSKDNLGRKMELFANLLQELRQRGKRPAYIDVRVPDRIVWGPAGSS
jgi:cell division septal protein FtsQ